MYIVNIIDKFRNKIRLFQFRWNYKSSQNIKWNCRDFLHADLEISLKSKVIVPSEVFFRNGCAIRVRDNATLKIGRNVNFSDHCILTCREAITIGDNVMFGPNTIIFDNDHDYKSGNYMTNYTTNSIVIDDNVWIGANVSILKGTHIKEGAVVGAGTVVKGVVDPNSICYSKQNIVSIKYK